MFTKRSFAVALLICFVGSLTFYAVSQAEEDANKEDVLKGNVICLLPDYESGNVKPVISTEPCDGIGPHAHVILDTRTKSGNVYAVIASPEAMKRLQQTSERMNVEIKGKISGDQSAWVITLE